MRSQESRERRSNFNAPAPAVSNCMPRCDFPAAPRTSTQPDPSGPIPASRAQQAQTPMPSGSMRRGASKERPSSRETLRKTARWVSSSPPAGGVGNAACQTTQTVPLPSAATAAPPSSGGWFRKARWGSNPSPEGFDREYKSGAEPEAVAGTFEEPFQTTWRTPEPPTANRAPRTEPRATAAPASELTV